VWHLGVAWLLWTTVSFQGLGMLVLNGQPGRLTRGFVGEGILVILRNDLQSSTAQKGTCMIIKNAEGRRN